VWLAGAGNALAQAAAEAAGAGAAAASSASGAASATGKAVGSVFGRVGAAVTTSTGTTPSVTTVTRRRSQGAASRGGAGGNGAPGTVAVLGQAPRIHFDVVSFKRCASGSPTEVDMPADGDYVAFHCQPVSRILNFAYGGAGSSNANLSGYPGWVDADRYDFKAEVAGEDADTWQKMSLDARRERVRRLLDDELKLETHEITAPQPASAPEAGSAQVTGVVVDHIERPAKD
jgi:hypothetical protein